MNWFESYYVVGGMWFSGLQARLQLEIGINRGRERVNYSCIHALESVLIFALITLLVLFTECQLQKDNRPTRSRIFIIIGFEKLIICLRLQNT